MDDQSNESDDESNESENENNDDIRGDDKIKFEILCGWPFYRMWKYKSLYFKLEL